MNGFIIIILLILLVMGVPAQDIVRLNPSLEITLKNSGTNLIPISAKKSSENITRLNNPFMGGAAPFVEWQKCYGGNNGDYAWCVEPISDGWYIVAGTLNGQIMAISWVTMAILF